MAVTCRRFWLTAPFAIVGLWDERREVRIPLFSNYREQATTPFVVFKATLQVWLFVMSRLGCIMS